MPTATGNVTRAWLRKKLRRLDLDRCSNLLAELLAAGQAVPRDKLALRLGENDLGRLERQLKDIDGVVSLTGGLSLTDDLRSHLLHRLSAS